MFNLFTLTTIIFIVFGSVANAGGVCELTHATYLNMYPVIRLVQGDKEHSIFLSWQKDGSIDPKFPNGFNKFIEGWKTLAAKGVCPNKPVKQNQCKIVPTGDIVINSFGITANGGKPFFILSEPEIVRQLYDKLVEIGFCAGDNSKNEVQISDPCKLSHYHPIVPGIQLLQGGKELEASTLGNRIEEAGIVFSDIINKWKRLAKAGVCPTGPDEKQTNCKIVSTSANLSNPRYYPNTWGITFNDSDPFFITHSEEDALKVMENLKEAGSCPKQTTALISSPRSANQATTEYHAMGNDLEKYKAALTAAVRGHTRKFTCDSIITDSDPVRVLLDQISKTGSGTIEKIKLGNESKQTMVFEYEVDSEGNLAFYRVELPTKETEVLSIVRGVYQKIPKNHDYALAAAGFLNPRILDVCRR